MRLSTGRVGQEVERADTQGCFAPLLGDFVRTALKRWCLAAKSGAQNFTIIYGSGKVPYKECYSYCSKNMSFLNIIPILQLRCDLMGRTFTWSYGARRSGLVMLWLSIIGSAAFGQVESPPVGFNILELAPGDADKAQLTFKAPQYGCEIKYRAVSTGLTATTLLDAASPWQDDAFNGDNGPHYVEIIKVGDSTTAPEVGTRRDIVDTFENPRSIQIGEPWPSSLLNSRVIYRIVKHWTIRELFGSTKEVGIASVVADSSLVDASVQWAENQFNGENGAHFVEVVKVSGISSHPMVGTRREIVGTGPITLTVDQPWPEISGIVTYRIVRHMAVRSNTSGNLRTGSPLTADYFQLWDGETYETYYYQTSGIGGIGWRKSGDQFSDAGDTVIDLGQAIIFRRGEDVPLSLVVRGFVKDGITPLQVEPGFNFLANPYASSMTLASSGLHTGNVNTGIAGGNLLTGDQILIWRGAIYDTYFYQSSGLGGVGWRWVGNLFADAGSAVIPEGSSVIIRRQKDIPFTWRVPPHPMPQP